MFKTLWQRFKQYYQERGEAELHSFFTTFIPAFGTFLLFFGAEPLTALSAGVLSQDVFMAVGLAMARSFFAALLYMFSPVKFPLRTVKK